ncbi:unnamed protein product [Mytilus edulis]|uniref:Uncharacterized protein n=1 Tax=Mytilus edulis TaxID=6550 RepID=A0A8S3T085_MYTED|nr:unnamed protein product [Mytilus edulis]
MLQHLLVAAIDIGTTYSRYAFSFREEFIKDPLKIIVNQSWNAGGRQFMSLKTSTYLPLDSDKNSLLLDSRQKTDSLIIVSIYSDLAVMNGAVIFGHKTSIIAQRISKYTYGFGKKKPFDRTKHHHNHHETVKGYAKCTHLFDAFITRYEIISSGKTVITTAKCRPSEDGIFKLRIFQTEKENPTYTDEEGCSVLGLITFKRTDSKSS